MTIENTPQGFSFSPAGQKPDLQSAAREFEALLIASLLKTARSAGDVLANPDSETGSEGYLELAEEHIARTLAQNGSFGIARMILDKMNRDHAGIDETASGSAESVGSRAP